MGYASRAGRARTSASNPQAFGVCDRCGIWTNHNRLHWQYDWRGASLMNIRLLVCDTCLDTPQQQLRAIVVPADPTAIEQPRTEPFLQDEANNRQAIGLPYNIWVNNLIDVCFWKNNQNQTVNWGSPSSFGYNSIDPNTGLPIPGGSTRITQTNDIRVMNQTGEPPGGRNNLPGTDWLVPAVIYDGIEIGLPYENTTVPYTGPLSPPYNYMVQWNNVWVFGDFWANNVNAGVNWTTTIL